MYRINLAIMAGLIAVMPTLAVAGDFSTVENNSLAIHAVPELVHQKVTFDVSAPHTPLDDKYAGIGSISVFTEGAGFKIAGSGLAWALAAMQTGRLTL